MAHSRSDKAEDASRFSNDKNEVLEELGTIDDGKTRIEVSICSYDGGEPKLSLDRFSNHNDGRRKLGRLRLPQVRALMLLLDESELLAGDEADEEAT